jgi:hypothetical protein
MASGGSEQHKWALFNVICKVDTDLAVEVFATVDPAEYCREVKVQFHYEYY